MWSKRFATAAAACLVAALTQGAATGTALADPRDPTKGERNAAPAPAKGPKKPGTVVLSTADSRFDEFSNNQGWWAAETDNYDLNDNFIVGPYIGEYRNFFTFDISTLGKNVSSATLEVNAAWVNGLQGPEVLQFHDVSTDAATLNANDGRNPAIFDDLGTGELYGEYSVGSVQEGQALSFELDREALRDLRTAVRKGDQYFSLGGRLLNGSPGSFVFGSSGGITTQLVVGSH